MTTEELAYADNGVLLSNTLSAYKIPDIKFTPDHFHTEFLEDVSNPHAVLKSKAVGEPPFMYVAIINALQAARPGKEIFYDSPVTPEKVLLNLYT